MKSLSSQQRPLISVIVPVYNVEQYLRRCVDSLLCQTYPYIEILLINDGSTDASPAICSQYAERDTRVTVVHQENGGLSAARNTGLDWAKGEFISFVDSDDFVVPKFLEVLYQTLQNVDADLSVCNYTIVADGNSGAKEADLSPVRNEVTTGREILTRKMLEGYDWYWVIVCTKLYRSSIFDSVRFPAGKLHEDEFVLHEVLLQTNEVACTQERLYCYWQREGSITNSTFNVRRLDGAEAQLSRADALMRKLDAPAAAYHACTVALAVLAKGYERIGMRGKGFRTRYLEIKEQFASVAHYVLSSNLPPMHRLRLRLNAMSPYWTWFLLERWMKKW